MSSPNDDVYNVGTSSNSHQKKYKGIRCRKWGKWVSEIRVPNSQDRLWLGSYSTPEGAAVAHDVALFCLRGPPPPESSWDNFNFPQLLPITTLKTNMSPRSIQKAASDAGMAIDASQLHLIRNHGHGDQQQLPSESYWPQDHDISSNDRSMEGQEILSISVEDYL